MKRNTKEQRDAETKAALRQRIEDIALGAEGDAGVLDSNGWFAGAHCLSRLLPAAGRSMSKILILPRRRSQSAFANSSPNHLSNERR